MQRNKELWDYDDYMQSEDWKLIRQDALERAGHRCEAEHDLHVHHLNYKRLGRERDGDLEVLCEECHAEIH